MSEGNRAKEIVLGDELGPLVVKRNGVKVVFNGSGGVVVYTNGPVIVYSADSEDKFGTGLLKGGNNMLDGSVHVHPAANDALLVPPAASAAYRLLAGTPAVGPAELKIGDRMADGTIFAGISPETNKPMYATPADAPLTYGFNQAQKYASKLDVHGHKDWRVPTKNELNVLFNNRAAIGGFNVTGSNPAGWYWSSSQDFSFAWAQRFSDGFQTNCYEFLDSSLRCVR